MRGGTAGFRALVAGLVLVVLTVAGVSWAYQLRPPWTLDIGDPGDAPFLTVGDTLTFHGDERDVDYRYRWTMAHSVIALRDIGVIDAPLTLTLRAQGFRPDPQPPPSITVTVNGTWHATVPLSTTMQSVTLGPVTGYPMARSLTVELDSPTFNPEGPKGRALGVKIDRITVGLVGAAPLILPPGWVLLAALAAVLGIFALLWRGLERWGGGAQFVAAVIGALLVLAGVLAGLVWFGFQTTWALGLIGWPLALVGLGAAGWPWLRGWPGWVDRLADVKSYVAPGLLALGLLLYGLWLLQLLPQVPWIGHADYADNAVVARNLAAGRGYVVDYLAQFYKTYPNSTHPAETWPILQPTLIAPFFVLFGPQEWAARLPNLLLLLGLGAAVYAFGARWWDRRVGLLAAGFTLLHPYLFKTVLYPINDLAYVLFALLTLGLAWETVRAAETRRDFGFWMLDFGQRTGGSQETGGRDQGSEIRYQRNPNPKIQNPKSYRGAVHRAGHATGAAAGGGGAAGAPAVAGDGDRGGAADLEQADRSGATGRAGGGAVAAWAAHPLGRAQTASTKHRTRHAHPSGRDRDREHVTFHVSRFTLHRRPLVPPPLRPRSATAAGAEPADVWAAVLFDRKLRRLDFALLAAGR